MIDPPRLLDGDDPETSRLLRAARDEAPSPHAVDRTLAAVAAGGAVLGAGKGAAGAAAVAKATGWIAVKWIVTGVVAGGVAAGAANLVESRTPSAPPREHGPSASRSVAAARPAGDVLSVPRDEPVGAPAAVETGDDGIEPRPEVAVPPSRHGRAPVASRTSAAPPVDSDLAAEVGALDQARALLAAGKAAAALDVLDRYQRESRTHHLLPEARYLTMEAHVALGDTPQAEGIARELSSLYPRGPHAERARSVLGDHDRR